MNNSDIKKIAESLEIRESKHLGVGVFIVVDMFGNLRDFDPINNWADTGLVLEKMIKGGVFCSGVYLDDFITGDERYRCGLEEHGNPDEWLIERSSETIQGSICKAYLAYLSTIGAE